MRLRGLLVALAGVLVLTGLQVVPAAAVGRVTYVELGPFTTGADGTGWGWADCPSGTKATGGGVYTLADAVKSSYPAGDGNGWVGSVRNFQPNERFWITAICVSGLTDYTIESDWTWVAPGVTTGRFAFCPAGREVLGGGAMDDSPKLTLRRTSFFDNTAGARDAWVSQYRNDDTVNHKATTYAVCANGLNNLSYQTSYREQLRNEFWNSVKVRCPAGTQPVSGGGEGPLIITTRVAQPDVWNLWASLDLIHDGAGDEYQATAICGS